jgi:hypothetical protein
MFMVHITKEAEKEKSFQHQQTSSHEKCSSSLNYDTPGPPYNINEKLSKLSMDAIRNS